MADNVCVPEPITYIGYLMDDNLDVENDTSINTDCIDSVATNGYAPVIDCSHDDNGMATPRRIWNFRSNGLLSTSWTLRAIVTTLSLCGLQIAFSLQFALGTNYLLSLGFTAATLNATWLIPPICGVFVQPLLGAFSDMCSSQWGRRRPFVAMGGAGLSLSILGLPWARDIAQGIDSSCQANLQTCLMAKILGVLFILFINFAAQAVQVGTRALIMEQFPADKQLHVNAWASRTINMASICSYFLFSADLSSMLPPGVSQIKIISTVSSLTIAIMVGVTCLGTAEQPAPMNSFSSGEGHISQIKLQFRRLSFMLSTELFKIYSVQFFSWFAWFPFMLYISSYVSSIHSKEIAATNSWSLAGNDPAQLSGLYGSRALLVQALLSLLTSLLLPLLFQFYSAEANFFSRKMYEEGGFASKMVPFSWLTYRNTWVVSQLLYSIGLIGILSAQSTRVLIAFVGMTGFSSAVNQWIPFVLMNLETMDKVSETADICSVGIIQGINNASIAAPQVLAMIFCTLIFWFVNEEGNSTPVIGIRWALCGSLLMSMTAAGIASRLKVPFDRFRY